MRPTKRLEVTLARIGEVSREASTACPAGVTLDFGGHALLAGGPLKVLDVLGCENLGDGGVHCSLLLSESTAIRVS